MSRRHNQTCHGQNARIRFFYPGRFNRQILVRFIFGLGHHCHRSSLARSQPHRALRKRQNQGIDPAAKRKNHRAGMRYKNKMPFYARRIFYKRCKSSFDYIFFDPPFPYKFHEQLVEQAAKNGMLAPGGTILVHRPEEHFMPDQIGPLKRSDQRIYGRSIVDFYGFPE